MGSLDCSDSHAQQARKANIILAVSHGRHPATESVRVVLAGTQPFSQPGMRWWSSMAHTCIEHPMPGFACIHATQKGHRCMKQNLLGAASHSMLPDLLWSTERALRKRGLWSTERALRKRGLHG
eukprot:1159088-Pelagomonas_calceolata.AAC.5